MKKAFVLASILMGVAVAAFYAALLGREYQRDTEAFWFIVAFGSLWAVPWIAGVVKPKDRARSEFGAGQVRQSVLNRIGVAVAFILALPVIAAAVLLARHASLPSYVMVEGPILTLLLSLGVAGNRIVLKNPVMHARGARDPV